MFLVHGWNMPPAVLLPLAQRLEAWFSVTLAAMPGYRATESLAAMRRGVAVTGSVETFGFQENVVSRQSAGRVLQSLLQQAPPVAHWVGWSLGATLAMQAALVAPDRIASMNLLSATPCFLKRDDWSLGFEKDMFEKLLRLILKRYAMGSASFLKIQQPVGAQSTALAVDRLQTLLETNQPTPESLQRGFEILCDCDLRSSIGKITTATQILAGETDNVIPPTASQFVADQVASGVFKTLGDGHAAVLANTEKYAQAIRDFCGSV